MRVAIYTAVFGDYDELKEVPTQDVECDLICFTDRPKARRGNCWRVMPVARKRELHPRMQAKYYKIMSQEIFPGGRLAFRYDPASALRFSRPRYDVTIWIDASLLIRSRSFARDISGFIGPSGWAMFSHPRRDCIFDEASVSAGMAKYHAMPIQEQVDYYRKTGVKAKSGLYACGVIARKEPLPESLRRASELWWNENVTWTYQDQLSLPFVLNQVKIGVDQIEGDLWNNKWFDLAAHKHEY